MFLYVYRRTTNDNDDDDGCGDKTVIISDQHWSANGIAQILPNYCSSYNMGTWLYLTTERRERHFWTGLTVAACVLTEAVCSYFS